MARIGHSGPATLDQLDNDTIRLTDAALSATSLHRKLLNLWKIEGLVFRFFELFTVEQRRLAAHGFGRAQYFRTPGFSKAVSRADAVPGLPAGAALRGFNSANSLINCRDLESLLANDYQVFPPGVADGLDGGLFNTLCLLEWAFPGCSEDLSRTSDRAARIISTAQTARDNELGPPMKA